MSTSQRFYTIHRTLWFTTTALTGVLAGFLISHCLILGRFFNWMLAAGDDAFFSDIFAPFRTATRANVHYNAVLWLSLLVGLLWLVSSFVLQRDRILALTAGLSSFWVGAVFFASGFAEAEEAVCSGVADQALRALYSALNLPLHRGFAVAYSLAFLVLLWAGSRQMNRHIAAS